MFQIIILLSLNSLFAWKVITGSNSRKQTTWMPCEMELPLVSTNAEQETVYFMSLVTTVWEGAQEEVVTKGCH